MPLEAPPPYTATSTNPTALHELQLNSLTSYLQHHVTSLPDRIRLTQQALRAEQTLADAALLDHIVPIVEEFLADLGARHGPVPLATLTLVPGAAVPKNGVLSGLEDMRRRGELCRVSRVSVNNTDKDTKSDSCSSRPRIISEDPSWAAGQEFSDWGRFDDPSSEWSDNAEGNKPLWWHDEEMARRLASYLQPKEEKEEHAQRSSVVQAVVEQRIPPKKEKKGWGWGRRASEQKSPEVQTPIPADIKTESGTPQEEQQKKGAEMRVTAQEVAFRHENEFGIWESVRGWGIIVSVQVRT
ncbi:hypothetical protein F4677DRAFT_448146 [Hypoxylon crocopeplum]|nr:hypothetical protein F4677DRAFT_448146 [Hypoxylon crocopeplum]